MPLDPVLLSTPGWEAVVGEPSGRQEDGRAWPKVSTVRSGGLPGGTPGREGGEGTSTDGLLSVALEEIISLNITGTTLVVVRSI